MHRRTHLSLVFGLLVVATAPAEEVRFARDVLPILAANCYQCHGPDEQTRGAGLRLDTREGATADRRAGAAVVPGQPGMSGLLARVREPDDASRMPPAGVKDRLTPEEIVILERWIGRGAEYEVHWSFVPPVRPTPPPIPDPAWARSPIDRFVRAKLGEAGLAPAGPSDRHAWMRRASLDLTGLPPTPADADAYAADPDPDAAEKVIDRLLASPALGERWGRVWLDLARYADSAGYAQDPLRVIWRYRDWVIDSINAGVPFDRFTVEQIAGDRLENPTENQLIATAFHRNTMTNSEGGTNDEEFRNAAVVDRVNTTMQVWMGMTMGCAQCHTHKYDPITHKEYFQMFAVFNNTADADRGDESPNLVRFTPEQERLRAELRGQIAALERTFAATPADVPAAPAAGPLRSRFVRVELLGKQKFLHLAEVQAFAGGRNLARDGTASQISTDYDGPAALAIDGNTDGDYANRSTSHTGRADDPWWEVDLGDASVLDRVVVWNRTDGGTGSRLSPFRVVLFDAERRPLWVKSFDAAPEVNVELNPPPGAERLSEADLATLAEYAATRAPASPEKARLDQLKKRLDDIKGVPTPVMEELPPGKRRETHVHLRGEYLSPGEKVSPGVPSIFHPLPDGAEADRLTVARWLVDERNPLTGRVTANRYWEELFGTGLVETSEDFGTQGEPPSHPEMLDWLATELIRLGWDTKRLKREIVLSATYGQASDVTTTKLEADPANRLLSRGPRYRLPAEMIRDQALAVAGLLSRKMKGPSVRPPQPKLGLNSAFGGSTDWDPSPGEDRYRRGLYTLWRRTTPYPSMVTFDAPSREVCTIRRIRTNTPLQALVTLNDPVYVEAAQGLARRLIREGGPTPRAKAGHGFRLCVARPATAAELDRLEALYAELLATYQASPSEAVKLATEPAGPLPEGADAAEAAAWTVVANVLMNLDEFLARR